MILVRITLGADLVGSELSYGFCRDGQGRFIPFSQKHSDNQKYENYIVWRKK